MTLSKLRSLIDRAAVLSAHIETEMADLAAMKAQIAEAALQRTEEHTPTDGGGAIWQIRDLVKITWPAPALRSFPIEDPKYLIVQQLAGDHFKQLFLEVQLIKPVKAFRPLAGALLDDKKKSKLLETIADEPSSPRFVFA